MVGMTIPPAFLWLAPGLPLLGAALMLLFGRSIDRDSSRPSRIPGLVCSTLVAASFLVAAFYAWQTLSLPDHRLEIRGPAWFAGGEWGLLLDPLSAELMLLVAGIGTLIHVYSTVYMSHDAALYRFFGGMNFFVAMMQLLVLANNYLLLFAGWEGVGFASYLLIGFYHSRWQAGVAGMKAFLINRTADVSMVLGLIFFILKTGTTHYGAVTASAAHWSDASITLAASFLLVGAMGKSAQFPLHIWLPDALEGPTPVSALIHSATMVCAGVYLIARSGFLFSHAPEVGVATTIIGTLTALIAASIALAENDIKRVLAYSTISQIGFMFVALGAGAYRAALFHLFTHAFFKSLLFLGSGSLIHALHGEQNLKHMGGLRREMPVTFRVMWIAAMALAAVPGFAGFFSKDAILGETLHVPNGWVFVGVGLFTSLLTAVYAWRLMFLAFYGEKRRPRDPVHESPLGMTAPMCVLSVFCVLGGWVLPLIDWSEWPLMLASGVIAASGIWLAWRYYLVVPDRRVALDRRFSPIVDFLRNRWYIDALYEERILNGMILRTASGASRADERILDETVNGAAWLTRQVSRAFRWCDRWIVDGLVRSGSGAVEFLSSPVRALQTGFLQTYAFLFVAGLLAALGYYLTR
jgi:NADH-quinone oxidoreductase subunit L